MGAQPSSNKQQHKIIDYGKDYRLRSNLHCWTKAAKQSKSLLFSRNFFEQSEKLMIWLPKNLGETQEKCLFGHTTKQPLSNFEPWKSWKYKQLWGLGPTPSSL